MNNINSSVSDIQEGLMETKLSVARLSLHAQYLLVDPKNYLKALDDVQVNTAMIADMCGSFPALINKSVSSIITSSSNIILQKLSDSPPPGVEQVETLVRETLEDSTVNVLQGVENLLKTYRPEATICDKLDSIITTSSTNILQGVDALLKDMHHPPPVTQALPEPSQKTLELLTKQIEELSIQNKEACDSSKQKMDELNAKVEHLVIKSENLSAENAKLLAMNTTTTPIKPSTITGVKQGSVSSPYDELALDYLKDHELEALVDLLNQMKFTELLGSREVQYYGQFKYRYGTVEHDANVAYPEIIKAIMEKINIKYGTKLNSCLITKYVDGHAECPPHPDNEPVINPSSLIFTLTIGPDGVRNMVFRSLSDNTIAENITLPSNSLLVFSRKSQEFYSHAIPADGSVKGIRFSLTFREISPYFLNSTCLIGDSNTWSMKFACNTKHCFGKWMPGENIQTPRIHQIPTPEELSPYRNFIINVGINDLDRSAPLPPGILVQQLEEKCYAIHSMYPKANILLAPLLPTKDRVLNNSVREFNDQLRYLCDKDGRLHLLNHHDNFTMPRSGLLAEQYASRKTHDIKHLNGNGILMLKNSFKDAVMNIRKRSKNRNSNLGWNYRPMNDQSSPKEPLFEPQFVRCSDVNVRECVSESDSEGSETDCVMPDLEFELDEESGAVVVYRGVPGDAWCLYQMITSDSPSPPQHTPLS